jgi:hypothetical protein
MQTAAVRLQRGRLAACLIGAILLFPWAGCGSLPAGGNAPGDGSDASARVASPFGPALPLTAQPGEVAVIDGVIDDPLGFNVYALGALTAGQELSVRVRAQDTGFNPAVAVFDADGNWMDLNDDGGAGAARLDGAVDFNARRATAQTYVVVSASMRSDTTGSYVLTVQRSADLPSTVAPDAQRVYLNFGGGLNVQIGGRPAVDIPAFSGALIGAAFAGATAELRERTAARVRQDFLGLEVEVYSSDEGPPPPAPYSTLYFGSYDSALLGVADSVDKFNAAPEQDAIVFVDTFSLFAALDPSIEELVHALANVASHEIGHLLGLHHTSDPTELMDISASLNELLVPQHFGRAPLNFDTFPAGYQDAPMLLHENIGGDLVAPMSVKTARVLRAKTSFLPRGGLHFGTACP